MTAAARPAKLSAQLAKIVGKDQALRTDVVRSIWSYIKSNNLQSTTAKSVINCNSELKSLFGKDSFSNKELFSLLSKHIEKLPKVEKPAKKETLA